MNNETKRVIWSNEEGYDPEEVRQQIAHDLGKSIEDVSDEEVYTEIDFQRDLWMSDERANLDKPLDGRILVIADLGLWNGRRSGYRLTNDRNLNGVLGVCQYDFQTVYFNGYDVCATDTHHDGTNRYTMRLVRDGVDVDPLLDALYDGTADAAMIDRYTESLGPDVCGVYGWDYAGKTAANGVRKAA